MKRFIMLTLAVVLSACLATTTYAMGKRSSDQSQQDQGANSPSTVSDTGNTNAQAEPMATGDASMSPTPEDTSRPGADAGMTPDSSQPSQEQRPGEAAPGAQY